VETLRKLRNDDSHGYDIPEFEEMYELFTQNEDVLVGILAVLIGASISTNKKNKEESSKVA
jgi:hypothetical protein